MRVLKRLALGGVMAAALAAPLLAPTPAEAWWRGGWGWHAGYGWGWHPGWGWGWHPWGWGGGVVVAAPPVVVAPPPVAYAPPPPYRWIPGYYAANGRWVPPHWGYY